MVYVDVYIPLRWVLNKPLVKITFQDEIGDSLSDYYNMGDGTVLLMADDSNYGPSQVMCDLRAGELKYSDMINFDYSCTIKNWNGVLAYEN